MESDRIKQGPNGLRVHIPIHLRWGDLDALGHVNNASMLRLIEEARLRAFWRAGDAFDAPSTAIMGNGVTGASDTMAVVAQQQIEYLTPVPYGRLPLDVQMWIGRLGGSSVEICYEVRSPAAEDHGTQPQITYARASGVMVMLDAATERPRKLTEEERAAWAPVVGEPISFGRAR
ncbi:MAG: acyl-CoA thioesterase [Microthrixaceae bacterium]|nr:acyl-CoA thioesterase [Microthrixaceae bacterium]